MPSPIPSVPRKSAEQHYQCEACGADLRFAPGQQRLVCDHCGHVQDIPAATGRGVVALRELPLTLGLEARLPDSDIEDHRTVSCPNCGATLEMAGSEHATSCPFCATPVVADTGARRTIKPQGVLPFVLTEEEARAALGRWLGSLWFAPSGLAQYARRGRRLNGVYTPFWTFDAESRTRYSGRRGDIYYETVQVTVMVDGRPQQQMQQVPRIAWSSVSGEVGRSFDDILIYAARSMLPGHVEGLAPWDLSRLVAYQPDYLAGFSAEGYTVELAEGHRLAQAEMIRVIQTDIRRDIGGDQQQILSMDPRFGDETFKHILLPVWTAAYRFQNRAFTFVVNAQTGQVQGERPWSPWKIVSAIIVAAIVIGAALYFKESH